MTMNGDRVVDAVSIFQLNHGFAQSKLLHSAVEIGLFELLAEAPAAEPEIRRRLGLHQRFTRDFLTALVALGLLERDGERYRNTEVTTEHLVPGGTLYLGGRVRAASKRHFVAWSRFTEALRDGKQKAGEDDLKLFETLYTDPEKTKGLLDHVDANTSLVGPQLAEFVDWSAVKSFVDVGGSRGRLATHLVTAHPHLRGTVFELPPVEPYFHELMAEVGLADKVRYHAGDCFADPLPETDVMIFGHILHDFPIPQRRDLLQRAARAVRPGGAVVVYDQMLDEEEPDLHCFIGSLNVALNTVGGSDYTVAECREWMEKAGLVFVAAQRFARGTSTAVMARREA
ncbi:methyltransferase [Amycolatopsis samaneae]|uniref:Methyltransferase n=1 Tax=Amycolatopsis samaneae TaxID=664691 RepID=A0ABW5GRQ9_9PSEU